MNLLPQEVRAQLPELGAQDGNPDAVAYVKFFTPDADWTWYVTEFDGKDLFFGLVQGLEQELGYFSLSDLEAVQGSMGLEIERDTAFKATPISQLRRQFEV